MARASRGSGIAVIVGAVWRLRGAKARATGAWCFGVTRGHDRVDSLVSCVGCGPIRGDVVVSSSWHQGPAQTGRLSAMIGSFRQGPGLGIRSAAEGQGN